MRHIFLLLILLASTGIAKEPQTHPTAKIKTSLSDLNKMLASDSPITKNPLQEFAFDAFGSRSYLHLYRALGYARMAKDGSQKLTNLDRALNDLKQAKLAPNSDVPRIDLVTTEVLKSKIEVLRAAKSHGLVIDSIELLPQKDKTDSRYIVYYAEALFNSSKIDDFKKFARNYLTIISDETVLKKYLATIPIWSTVISTITIPESQGKQTIASPAAPMVTKEMLVSEPVKVLGQLRKGAYFKSAEVVFKMASELYFANYKKEILTSPERKFVNAFRRRMHYFAPAFIDSLIFSFWKKTDLKTAEMLSHSFLDQFEGHPLYPKVLYNLGRIQEDSKNYAQSARTFKNFLDKSDDATYLEPARFRAAWTLYLAQREKESKPYFEEYVRAYPDGRYASTCEYFLLKINGKETGAPQQESIHAFIKKYPLNLYSFLLMDEHKLSDTLIRQTLSSENGLKSNLLVQEFKADIKTLNQLRLYQELKEFGLRDDAIKVLKDISSGANNEFLTLYLASQFQDLENTHGEVSNLIKIASSTSSNRVLVPWKSLFPDYRRDAIEKELALQDATISPLLVLALIRQESAFDKTARSTANAVGLMQLTAGTAKDAAKRLQLSDYSLLNEDDNLRLGIKIFADLLKKYNRIDYALAAYNAGETAAGLWIALRGHLDPILFIESIPYQETRVYVKSILRNLAIYRMLYEANPTPLVSYNF